MSAEEKEAEMTDLVLLAREEVDWRELEEYRKNQAASRDYMLLMQYLQTEASATLYNSYAGAYIDDTESLVVKLIDNKGSNELKCLDWETSIVIRNGKNSYFKDMMNLERLNTRLGEVYKGALDKSVDSDLEELMHAIPCTNYDVIEGIIEVRLIAKTQSDFERAVMIFKKEIGEYKNVKYKKASLAESILHPASFSANPGSSITISDSGDYSLGFRAYYDYDGETNYGFVTCAHGNSIGQLVTLNPAYSGYTHSLGVISKRVLGGSVDAAFVQVTNGDAAITQTVQYASNSLVGPSGGTIYQPAVLNGTYYTPAVGTIFYKSGGSTKLTKGKIESTNQSGSCMGFYFEGLILSYGSLETPQMIQSGDSGGVAFTITNGTNAKCVGIALGNSTWFYYFLKPGPILNALNVVMY